MSRPPFQLALITGASSGLGKEIAFLLASKGISLLLVGRSEKELNEVANQLSPYVSATPCVADLEIKEQRDQVICLIKTKEPDLVINNAGLGFYGALDEIGIDKHHQIIEVNILTILELTLETIKMLKCTSKRGLIVNISSIAGEFPMPYMATYGASKAFVTSFSKAVDFECRCKGIRVLASLPGQISTHFAQKSGAKRDFSSTSLSMPPKKAAKMIWKQIEKKIPYLIFDFRYRFFSWFIPFIPEHFLNKIIATSIQKRL